MLTFFTTSISFNRQSLKARIRETKSICVELNVRKYSHQQMDTNFGRYKTLALRKMAGDELNDDVNNATSFLKRS